MPMRRQEGLAKSTPQKSGLLLAYEQIHIQGGGLIMARGNSKGIRRDKMVNDAIATLDGEPFTASDLLDIIEKTSKRAPSVREIGMVLSKKKRLEEIRYIGEVGTRQNREMLEAAGLTQHGVRKTALYVDGPPLPDETVAVNNRDAMNTKQQYRANAIIKGTKTKEMKLNE